MHNYTSEIGIDTYIERSSSREGYERAGAVSDLEAQEMFTLAMRIRQDVEHWLLKDHPHLLKK